MISWTIVVSNNHMVGSMESSSVLDRDGRNGAKTWESVLRYVIRVRCMSCRQEKEETTNRIVSHRIASSTVSLTVTVIDIFIVIVVVSLHL